MSQNRYRSEFFNVSFWKIGLGLFFWTLGGGMTLLSASEEYNDSIADLEIVQVIKTGENNLRNGEGAFISLKNGDILHIYSHFYGGSKDHSPSYLASRRSSDGGKSWTKSDKIELENEGVINTMSVSLLRLADGNLALFYGVKEEIYSNVLYMRVSTDEGESWGERVRCTDEKGYFVLNNDRVIQIQDGTILIPVSQHTVDKDGNFNPDGIIYCRYSTDNGKTWRSSAIVEHSDLVLQEPGLVELADGSILLYCRSGRPVHILSRSTDGGRTWSPYEDSCFDSALCAPALIKRIPNSANLLVVWNPHIDRWARTKVDMAILTPDAREVVMRQRLNLPDPDHGYQYPQILFTDEDHFLVGFFDWNVGLYVLRMTWNPDAKSLNSSDSDGR